MKKVTLQIPATSANCGPGFDSLGLALNFYNEVTYEILDHNGMELTVQGEGADYLKPFGGNLAFRSFYTVWNELTMGEHIGLKVSMVNRIPLSRGLGSSSACIVGGVMAASILSGANLSQEQLLHYANTLEGHPDNVAPAIFGNFTISYLDGQNNPHSLVIKPAKPLKFIALVPQLQLSTEVARQAIPASVPHKDAVFNTSRSALLVGAILSGNYDYLAAALEDKLHQPYRAHLIPGLKEIFAAARQAGAYNAIISGAGSTVMAYASPEADCEKIGKAMQAIFTKNNIKSNYHIFDLDKIGAKVLDKT
ncbi:MAG: homoserine kinase [Phascolarctobacterium sp.]|nr:homoserine kinase [Phascolarctobacterium sp.]